MAVRKEEVRVTADVSNFVTKMSAAGAAASGFAARLDEADGRMSNLVQTGLALAPALVPLGAAAIPAVVGLANQLGVAAAAAGVAVLAFQGVGTAIKAIDAYKAAPTAANFAKLQLAMSTLGPAAQEFSLQISKLEPKLRSIQKVAAQGLLPDVGKGLNELLPLIPEVNRVVFALSSTLGDLVLKGARDLRSSEWQSFFTFLEADASVTLMQMGRTVGNLATGFRDLWQAFAPLESSFSAGLEGMSKSFADWASGLAQTQGFQDFLAYIDKSGPQALAALGAIADALLKIVEAAAPVGSAVLPVITELAKGISALADSSVGPTLITIAAAVGVLGRSLALLKSVGARGGSAGGFLQANVAPGKGVIATFRQMRTATDELRKAEQERARVAASTRDSQFALVPTADKRAAITQYASALTRQGEAERKVAEAAKSRSAAIRESATAFGKGAVAAGGLALATSGLADGFGLSNTASLAMMGTLVGPWGTAVGAGVGLVKDFASANNDLESAVKASGAAVSGQGASFSSAGALLQRSRKDAEDYGQSVHDAFDFTKVGSIQGTFRALAEPVTHASREGTDAIRKQTAAYMTMRQNAAEVYADLNHGSTALVGASDQVADAFINHITPALTKAGIKAKDFKNSFKGSPLRIEGEKAIRSYFEAFNSATGKSKSVGAALANLGSQMDTDASKANALKAAMDSLFGTELTQSAATDAWTQSLRDLDKQLTKSNGHLLDNSKGALANRAAVRGSVQALEDKVNADAAAGVSGAKLADSLVRGREALIKQGVAAGISRSAMTKYLNTLGLTPKNLTTIIKADGALSSMQKVQALGRLYKLTPRQIRTLISEAGSKPTEGKIRALAKLYHLTPKEVHTLLSATDAATRKALTARANAEKFRQLYLAVLDAKDPSSAKSKTARDRALAFAKKYAATLDANDPALGIINTAIAALNAFDGRHATATMTTIHTTVFTSKTAKNTPANPTLSADGSLWSGRTRQFASGGYTDAGQYVPRVPQMRQGGGNILWSEPETGWEAYISGKPGMRNRNLEILSMAADRLGATVEYAAGHITPMASGGSAGGASARRAHETAAAHKQQLKAISMVSKELTKLSDKLKATRQASAEYKTTVAQAFVSSPFGGTLGGFNSQIGYETKKLRGTDVDLRTLKSKGLNGALYKDLAASGNSALIDQFAKLTRAQIVSEEQRYGTRNRLDNRVGADAASQVYGQRVAQLSGEVAELTKELHKLRTGHHIGNTQIQRQINRFDGVTAKKQAAHRAKHS